jgi:hypothetical protein
LTTDPEVLVPRVFFWFRELDPVIGRHLGLPCSRCGRRERTADDLHRLFLAEWWTLEDLGPWRAPGLTVRQLVALGVRIEKLCLPCQSSEDDDG